MGGCKTSLLRSHFFFDKHIPGGSRYRKVINGFYMAMRGQYLIPGRLGPGLPGPAWSRNRAVLPFALRGTASFNASSVWWFKVKWQAADMSWKMSWAQWGGTGWQGSFLLIFPVSDSSPRCRHGMQQRKRSAFVNLKAGPFGLRFREEVVGNTDPATAAEKSLRGIFHKSWAEPWTQRSDLAARAERPPEPQKTTSRFAGVIAGLCIGPSGSATNSSNPRGTWTAPGIVPWASSPSSRRSTKTT